VVEAPFNAKIPLQVIEIIGPVNTCSYS